MIIDRQIPLLNCKQVKELKDLINQVNVDVLKNNTKLTSNIEQLNNNINELYKNINILYKYINDVVDVLCEDYHEQNN